MYHVVVGVAPGDSQLSEKIEAVAALPRTRVTVVHVPEGDNDPEAVPAVADALSALREAGVECEAVAGDGSPSQALRRTADELDADCLCVAGRRRSPAGKLLLKSGAQELILNAERPVLVAGRAD